MGIPAIYGLDPSAPFTGPEPQNGAIVCIMFKEGGTITARNAYFTRKGDDAATLDCLIPWLCGDPKGKNPCSAYVDPGNPNTPRNGQAYRVDFDYFDFGSPHVLYVYIDNPGVAFDSLTPVSFTPFGSGDEVREGSTPTRNENTSWSGASVGALAGSKQYSGLTIYNAFRGANGEKADSPEWKNALFSMNLHLRACPGDNPGCNPSTDKGTLAIVIDPDTGNGQGSRP